MSDLVTYGDAQTVPGLWTIRQSRPNISTTVKTQHWPLSRELQEPRTVELGVYVLCKPGVLC